MPERQTVSNQVQIGLETTPGTLAAANKLMTALSIEPSPNFNFTNFAPMGFKYDTLVALLQEWTQAALAGYPTYTEIVYPLSSVLVAASPATVTGVTTWTFTPASQAADTVKTFTVERGQPGLQLERFTHGLVSEFGITFSPTEASLSGSMFGRALEVNATATPAPTTVELIPVLPTQVQVSIDTTQAALGTTIFTRVLSAAWSITNRFSPLFVLNSANTSFVAAVELKPETRIEMSLEADAAGMGLFTSARLGEKKWVRIKGTGPNIVAGTPVTPNSLQIDACGIINNISGMGDQDGVYKIDLSFNVVHDGTWGKAQQVIVKNGIAAL